MPHRYDSASGGVLIETKEEMLDRLRAELAEARANTTGDIYLIHKDEYPMDGENVAGPLSMFYDRAPGTWALTPWDPKRPARMWVDGNEATRIAAYLGLALRIV